MKEQGIRVIRKGLLGRSGAWGFRTCPQVGNSKKLRSQGCPCVGLPGGLQGQRTFLMLQCWLEQRLWGESTGVDPVSAPDRLCGSGQVTYLLWASVSPSVKWGQW